MTKISTAQFRALRAVRLANDEDRGFMAPRGSAVMAFRRMKEGGLLEGGDAHAPLYWITPEGRTTLARVEGSAPAEAPKGIAWPAVVTFADLKAALRRDFSLVQMPKTFKFALKHGAQFHTSQRLHEIAERANQSGWAMFMCPLDDGSRLYKLTTRAGDELPAHTNPQGEIR